MKPVGEGPDANVIQKMFDEIAPGYDVTNSILSLGIHHLWRWRLVRWSGAKSGDSVLDCATGTGDLATSFKRAVTASGKVIGTDFSAGMIGIAIKKAQLREINIDYSIADVSKLPFADESFDVASISFGIRNVENRAKAISELYRVLKPGGRMMILEFGQPTNRMIRVFFNFYSERVLPKVGQIFTGKSSAYDYLQRSSASFPCKNTFVDFIRESAPFDQVEFQALSFGIAYMYRAIKAASSEGIR